MADDRTNADYTQPVDTRLDRAGMPGDGEGRREDPGETGVYPASGPLPDDNAPAQGMASFGQGDRGDEGYNDSGSSELDLTPESLKDEPDCC